jgi:Flp pilus assembly protein TadB
MNGQHDSENRRRAGEPILITGAPQSPRAELQYRQKRYAITMGIRVVCLILVAVFHSTIWLWPIFALGAIALPWIAVLLANDRLPTNSTRFQQFGGAAPKELPAPDRSRVIDE